jgi:hypothetical protein
MSKKDFEQIAEAIRTDIFRTGNSTGKQAIIRVLANTFGEINPRFDRSRFFNACDYATALAPVFYQGDLSSAFYEYKQSHPEAQMGDGIKALAKMVEAAGGNPGEFIAFATVNPIPEALRDLRKYGPTTQE